MIHRLQELFVRASVLDLTERKGDPKILPLVGGEGIFLFD